MKKKLTVLLVIIAIVIIGGILVGPIMSRVETPNYEVVATDKNIEIRRYPPMIVAEVEIKGKRQKAISDGFRLLADYIFGNNSMKKDIAMTAPVQQQSTGTLWKISFVMPHEYTLNSLPKPNNDRIAIKEVPSETFAVIQFSGTSSDKNLKKHEIQLIEYIKAHQIKTVGFPKYAFYNPPWTLPFMRRNEVMIEVSDSTK